MNKATGVIGCLAAMTAIMLGAFGAHALKETLMESGMLDVWRTAADYHLWHALALVLCTLVPGHRSTKGIAAVLLLTGIVLFSGSLYWLALGGPGWLGPVTPLGGLSLIGAWLALAIAIWRGEPTSPKI